MARTGGHDTAGEKLRILELEGAAPPNTTVAEALRRHQSGCDDLLPVGAEGEGRNWGRRREGAQEREIERLRAEMEEKIRAIAEVVQGPDAEKKDTAMGSRV